MTQMLGDIRSGLVLLMALAVSGAGWWLVVAEPETLPGFICGVAGYGVEGAWSVGLLVGRAVMWLAMMLAMALPVGVLIGLRSGRVPDAAFLAGYAGTAAGVAIVAAVAEWSVLSLGLGGDGPGFTSGIVAGAAFLTLGLFNLGAAATRRSPSCMQIAVANAGTPERVFLSGLCQGRLSLICSITMAGLQLTLGTMSHLLMLAMTLWMLAESLFPQRRELPMALGASLVVAGLSVIGVTSLT